MAKMRYVLADHQDAHVLGIFDTAAEVIAAGHKYRKANQGAPIKVFRIDEWSDLRVYSSAETNAIHAMPL